MARVLVVDDQAVIATVLQEVLVAAGYQVETALGGMAAWQRLSQAPIPDVVITDLWMPGMSGRNLVESMQSDQVLCNIPVVLMSGLGERSDDCPPAGSYEVLMAKPFDMDEMVSCVGRVLERVVQAAGGN